MICIILSQMSKIVALSRNPEIIWTKIVALSQNSEIIWRSLSHKCALFEHARFTLMHLHIWTVVNETLPTELWSLWSEEEQQRKK